MIQPDGGDVSVPSWIVQMAIAVFGGLLTGAGTVVTFFAKSLRKKVNEMERNHTNLLIELPTKYVTRDDFKDSMKGMFDRLDNIEKKLDRVIERDLK